MAATDESAQPGWAADFENQRASILAQQGDHAAAYAALCRAETLRQAQAKANIRPTLIRMVPQTTQQESREAAELAAVRAALREAELTQSLLRQRVAFIAGAGALLLAVALGIAYSYKRKAAAALAAARDAAELRAERTHWQMLRYQLNPHFLFNALSSLSGLVATDPPAARRVIGRLSDFCRFALQRTTHDLRTVAEEIQVLDAFLDVEKAGAGGNLRTTFAIAPAVSTCLLPPLLLQPLVENALKYGGHDDTPELEVAVSARPHPAGDQLVIEIANNGTWIEPATRPRRGRASGGIGLTNVRERLARVGAGPDALTIEATHDGWVRVRLTLPLLSGPSFASA